MNNLELIKEFVVENFLFGDGDRLDEETSFFESGIVDSTGVVELIAFLEETYGVKVNDEEIIPENFDNLKNIGQFIERKRQNLHTS